MNIKNLNVMIEHMAGVREEDFTYDNVVTEVSDTGCGTVGCLIGHAPHMFPEWVKHLPVGVWKGYDACVGRVRLTNKGVEDLCGGETPKSTDYLYIGMALLAIPLNVSNFIFCPESRATDMKQCVGPNISPTMKAWVDELANREAWSPDCDACPKDVALFLTTLRDTWLECENAPK